MNYIYLPIDTSGHCVEVLNGDIIRVYNDQINIDSDVSYTDYYINSHYIEVSSYTHLEHIPACVSSERLTTSFVYRNDFGSICIILFVFLFILYFIISTLVKPFFRRVR